jgi:hypothetical protein
MKINRVSIAFALGLLLGAIAHARAQDAPTTQPDAAPSGVPLFSEDFESGKIDPAIWEQRVVGTPTIAVQQDTVAHGKNALAVHYPVGTGRFYAFLVATKLPAELKDHLFGRVYVMVTPGTPPMHTVLMLAGTPNWPIADFLELGVQNKKFQPSYQQNDTTKPRKRAETVKHGVAFPTGKWFCLEFEFNDKPDTITTWIDGEKADGPLAFAMAGEGNTGLVGGFTNFAIGTRVWGNTVTAFDVYYDDLALGTSRLGVVKKD